MFELQLPSGTKQLKWGYWAMKQFCKVQGIKPTEYFQILIPQFLKDEKGNNTDILDPAKPSILDYVSEFLQIGAEYAGKVYTEVEVCEWIDEAGGVKAEGVIMDYLKYVIASHTTNLSEKEEAEKKS